MFAKQVEEIAADRALTVYGAALAAANVLTFFQWKFRNGVPSMIGRSADSLCWPFWESCHAFQLPVFVVNDGLWIYALLSVAAACLFLTKRALPAYWLLLVVNAIRVFVMFQDYRLRANQHYMLNWIVIAFLFLPAKRALAHHVLVSLYFWAGVLKLDRDWFSGAALYGQERLWFPSALVPASCVYIVVLETVLIWGVYSRRAWVFYGTLAQLALFHLTSWAIVGFWYPTLMFCLLSILPLTRRLHPPGEWIAWRWRTGGGRRRLELGVVAALALFQMIPRAFPGDTAVTGEGRLFALHMFDALIECEAVVTYHENGGRAREDRLDEARRMPHRSRCDPAMYFTIAKNRCGRLRSTGVDLDLSLRSKRNSEPDFHQVIDIRSFCASNPSYDIWRHNTWIQVPSRW